MKPVLKWVTRFAEFMAAMMMAAMFATFIVQIAIRYSARVPWIGETMPFLSPDHYGWTLEFCLALWVWIIFFGNSFIVRRSDHVQFDMLFWMAPHWLRKVFLVITGVAICGALLWSLEPTWAKFYILRLKKTATLSGLFGDWLRMRHVYAIYVAFLVIVALRFGWSAIQALRSNAPELETAEAARGSADGPSDPRNSDQ